jgi:hypothetical protein
MPRQRGTQENVGMSSTDTRRAARPSLALPLQMFAGLVIGLLLAVIWPSFAASLSSQWKKPNVTLA